MIVSPRITMEKLKRKERQVVEVLPTFILNPHIKAKIYPYEPSIGPPYIEAYLACRFS